MVKLHVISVNYSLINGSTLVLSESDGPGRAHIKANYSLERVVGQWEELYREVLQRKGMLD